MRDVFTLFAREAYWRLEGVFWSFLMFLDCVFLQLIPSCEGISTHITSNLQMMVENVLTHHVKVGGLVLFALAAHLQGVTLRRRIVRCWIACLFISRSENSITIQVDWLYLRQRSRMLRGLV